MRAILAAAVASAALMLGGVAAAEQWADPAGRLTFERPSGWQVQPQNAPGQTVVLAFNPQNDCYIFGLPNPNTAASSVEAARHSVTPISPEAWQGAGNVIRDFFPGNSAQLVSQSVDTSHYWPVQRAELSSGSRTVYAVILGMPGVELRAFCSGASSAAAYETIFSSLGNANFPSQSTPPPPPAEPAPAAPQAPH